MLSIPDVFHATSRRVEALAAGIPQQLTWVHRDCTAVFPRSDEGQHYAMNQSMLLHFEIVLSC